MSEMPVGHVPDAQRAGEEAVSELYGEMRFHPFEGKTYVIRDVFLANGAEPYRRGSRFVRCDYATCVHRSLDDDSGRHGVKWTPCAEGAEFADIQPLTGLLVQRPKTGDYTFWYCPETGEEFASKDPGVLHRMVRRG